MVLGSSDWIMPMGGERVPAGVKGGDESNLVAAFRRGDLGSVINGLSSFSTSSSIDL